MESPRAEWVPKAKELSTEEVQDAQIGLLEWELEERDKQQGIDHLTGASTRKVFEREFEQALKMIRGEVEEKREGIEPLKEVSLISIDIDHFKQVNDTLGHPAGDEVLRRVAGLLLESVRETDTVARVGGEELMVLLPGADVSVAARHAEELRTKIAALTFSNYPELEVTASFGVISSQDSTDEKTLYNHVDKALYAAKRGGRNRVEVYNEV
ncbi:GGDEF domain-containing protein [Patescibacteria group bacterium]|nr:GGDEF domain-containing protein [Patescibacteria group bacterium]